MTQKEQLQQLKKKISEYVEDIKKLEVGCKLLSDKGAWSWVIAERVRENGKEYQIWGWDGWHNKEFIEKEYEIIGREITLEDVLISLGKDSEKWKETKEIGELISREILLTVLNDWIMNQPLENQSEELRDFLYDILN